MKQYPTGISLGSRVDLGLLFFFPAPTNKVILSSDQLLHSLHWLASLAATLGQSWVHLEGRNKWQVLGTAFTSTALCEISEEQASKM